MPPSRFSFMHRWRAYFELGAPDLFALLYRAWPIVTGPLTIALVVAILTPELQGYYFTFTAVLAMQILLELGLGKALQQITSHEWAKLELNAESKVTGDERAHMRVGALVRFTFTWYGLAAVICVLAFGFGGNFFFSRSATDSAILWREPWLFLTLCAGANLLVSSALPILEGCNQVRQVYGFRMVQGFVTRLALWIGLLLGGGLWALVLERLFMALTTTAFLLSRYKAFFADLLAQGGEHQGFWRKEIWPLQWRFAVVVSSGFVPMLCVPVLFAFDGPTAAGRIGMTWGLTSALLSLSFAVVQTKTPRLAIMAAKREFQELDRLFARTLYGALAIMGLGSLLVVALVFTLNQLDLPLAHRFLPLVPTLLFLVASWGQLIKHSLATYLRAHKKEPFLVLSLVEAALILGALYPLGRTYGALGLAWGFAAVGVAVLIPAGLIFRHCREHWHR